MIDLERVAEKSKNNMYNNTFDDVSAQVQQPACNLPAHTIDQHDANAENHTHLSHHTHCNDILTEYPAWSVDTNDMENTNSVQYSSRRQDILIAWQKDTPVKTLDNSR